jgi:hypothetical protein
MLPNPWGEPPPDDSPYGHSAFAGAAPSEPRTTGACIHRDKCRFWLQTVKLSDNGPTGKG